MAELASVPLRVGEAPTTDDEGAEMSTVDEGAEIPVVCNICCEATEVFPLACCQNLICFSCVSKHAETAKSTFRCPFCKCDDATFFDCVSARGVVQRTSGLPDYAKTKISHPKREYVTASRIPSNHVRARSNARKIRERVEFAGARQRARARAPGG